MKKLHNNRGETLIEVLVSILIAALSITLMFACVMVSTRMDERARALDDAHYSALSEADAQPAPIPGADTGIPPGTVTVARIDPEDPTASPKASQNLDILIYGTEGGGMYSYKRKQP